MRRRYIQPDIEISPIIAMTVLCVSGEENSGLGGAGDGDDPYTHGRAPKF
jgi:hypothetical protein